MNHGMVESRNPVSQHNTRGHCNQSKPWGTQNSIWCLPETIVNCKEFSWKHAVTVRIQTWFHWQKMPKTYKQNALPSHSWQILQPTHKVQACDPLEHSNLNQSWLVLSDWPKLASSKRHIVFTVNNYICIQLTTWAITSVMYYGEKKSVISLAAEPLGSHSPESRVDWEQDRPSQDYSVCMEY